MRHCKEYLLEIKQLKIDDIVKNHKTGINTKHKNQLTDFT
jgi:hypothetical protein